MNCPFCEQENITIICPSCGWSAEEDDIERELPNYEMLSILATEFWMGSPTSEEGRDQDENLHLVKLTRNFQIGRTEVSQELYEAIMGQNPSYFQGEKHPVENITWKDAIEFCNRYSEICGLEPVYSWLEDLIFCNFKADGFRLPSEAEWELVAKLFAKQKKSDHSQLLQLETMPVDTSGSEISELDGNVWEFCWDFYGPYPAEKTTDPAGPTSGTHRVIRGGSWVDGKRIRRPANRAFVKPDHHSETIGFRLAATLKN